jgi:hypothetical protein
MPIKESSESISDDREFNQMQQASTFDQNDKIVIQ